MKALAFFRGLYYKKCKWINANELKRSVSVLNYRWYVTKFNTYTLSSSTHTHQWNVVIVWCGVVDCGQMKQWQHSTKKSPKPRRTMHGMTTNQSLIIRYCCNMSTAAVYYDVTMYVVCVCVRTMQPVSALNKVTFWFTKRNIKFTHARTDIHTQYRTLQIWK